MRELLVKGWVWVAETLDRRWGWNRLPKPLAFVTLIGLRMNYRRENLYDTTGVRVGWGPEAPVPGRSLVRTADGTGTDPNHPEMGSANTRFGHNILLDETYRQDVLTPSPRTVSTELLARRPGGFIAAKTLNLLLASWLQFEVHDWMSHGTNELQNPWEIALDDDDPWPVHPMEIRRTKADPTSDGGPPTYTNTETHWWDASQVYGSSPIIEAMIRTLSGGHLKLTSDGVVPFDPPNMTIEGLDIAGVTGNWWLGLAMFHTLFMREHNSICDHLARAYPGWTDQQLYDHARLVNAALIAKIHTVEWTTALLADSVMERGMRANWWGFQGQRLWERLGRLTKSEELSGIPGSDLYYHGVPYAMTEEFVAVYRMHPLIPDEYSFRSADDNHLIGEFDFKDIAGKSTHDLLDGPKAVNMSDLFYSFGTSHPGAIVLHNFPKGLRQFTEPDGTILDLAATDILRVREHGVPRYNEFRRRFHLRPAERFEDFSDDPEVVADLRRIYASPEEVDLMVGLYTEEPPEGFAISDTAFRVFIVMASRRLKSDRFYTYDYRPEVYTPEGLRWIDENSLSSVLLRHYPGLRGALRGLDNAFKPWHNAGAG